jgi:ParB/RepB/Spo0J family partition protein
MKFYAVPIEKITVSDRRRIDLGNLDELASSIARHGLLHPIIVTKDLRLVAGERRFRACQKLHWKEIPIQWFEETDEYTLEAVELEENTRRLDFNWKELAGSVYQYHLHRRKRDTDWDTSCTADALSISETVAKRAIAVAKELAGPNAAKILVADSINSAYNILARENQRATEVEAALFLSTAVGPKLVSGAAAPAAPTQADRDVAYKKLYFSALGSVFNCTFDEYLEKDWKGTQFSVVHCDFPYGIGHDESDQGNVAAREGEAYSDTPEIFWGLCNRLKQELFRPINTLFQPKVHIFFWYPVAQYTEIVRYWTEAGLWVDPVPYIWFKSDNTGILPDAKRSARRVYESALLMSLGDRNLTKPISNVFAHPSRKATAQHPSEKPYEVVKYFLSSIVDQYTNVIDPTCGGGSALAAADSLGSPCVVGCEINKIHADTARSWLMKVRSGV